MIARGAKKNVWGASTQKRRGKDYASHGKVARLSKELKIKPEAEIGFQDRFAGYGGARLRRKQGILLR